MIRMADSSDSEDELVPASTPAPPASLATTDVHAASPLRRGEALQRSHLPDIAEEERGGGDAGRRERGQMREREQRVSTAYAETGDDIGDAADLNMSMDSADYTIETESDYDDDDLILNDNQGQLLPAGDANNNTPSEAAAVVVEPRYDHVFARVTFHPRPNELKEVEGAAEALVKRAGCSDDAARYMHDNNVPIEHIDKHFFQLSPSDVSKIERRLEKEHLEMWHPGSLSTSIGRTVDGDDCNKVGVIRLAHLIANCHSHTLLMHKQLTHFRALFEDAYFSDEAKDMGLECRSNRARLLQMLTAFSVAARGLEDRVDELSATIEDRPLEGRGRKGRSLCGYVVVGLAGVFVGGVARWAVNRK